MVGIRQMQNGEKKKNNRQGDTLGTRKKKGKKRSQARANKGAQKSYCGCRVPKETDPKAEAGKQTPKKA